MSEQVPIKTISVKDSKCFKIIPNGIEIKPITKNTT